MEALLGYWCWPFDAFPSYLLRLHPKFGYRKPLNSMARLISHHGGGFGYCIDVGFEPMGMNLLFESLESLSCFSCRFGRHEWVKKIVLSLLSIFPNCEDQDTEHSMVLTNSVEFIHQSFWIFSIQHYKGTDTYSCLRCKLRCLVLECVALSHETAFKITSIPGPNTDHLVYQIIEWEKYPSLLMRARDAPMFFGSNFEFGFLHLLPFPAIFP